MKVLKAAPAFKPIKITCPHCGAELVADSPDDYTRHEGYDQRDQEGWDYLTVDCPCCELPIRIESKDSSIPKHMLSKIRKSK